MVVVASSRQYSTVMLSYLHGYHAGNHADVLKHTVLTALPRGREGQAARYIDTHAGAGGDLRAAPRSATASTKAASAGYGPRATRRRPWRAGSGSRNASTVAER
jgi:23S rRNA (adenine2030-N6)-methyltransferase